MVNPKSVLIKVPATSANLGSGFDCLGLALDLWNEIEFSIFGDSLQIEIIGEGADSLPKDATNLIFQCMQTLLKSASLSIPKGIQIKCRNKIPVSSGLGSSAAAVIAGLLGTRKLFDLQLSDYELLKTALTFEGHSDNISACLKGGLTITALSAGELVLKKLAIKPLQVVIAFPEVKLSTHLARALLPETVPMRNAIFNISRTGLLINAFQEGNYEFLRIAMEDRLHQSYRLGLIPGAEKAISNALEADAIGAALSGAGPGVIAFVNKGDQRVVGKSMIQAFKNANIPARLFSTISTNQGAQVILDE
jgi:homoserine kinase